jgi:PAS domain S-box-containing protein
MFDGGVGSLDGFRVFADALPLLVWTADAAGECLFLNAHWYAYTGRTSDDCGRAWYEAIHPDQRAVVRERWEEAVQTGEPFETEMRFRGADGSYRTFLTRGTAVRDASGAIRTWYGTCTDIEDQKHNEESLRFLGESGEILASSIDIESTLRALARLTTESIADWCAVYIFDEPETTLRPVAIANRDRTAAATMRRYVERYPLVVGSRLARIAATGKAQLVGTIGSEILDEYARFPDFHAFIASLQLRSSIVVPIVARGHTLGVLQALTSHDRVLTDGDLRLAELLAKRAAVAIDNAMLYDEQRRTARRLRFMAQASENLAHSLDLEETIATIVRLPVPEFADWTIINLIQENGAFGRASAYHGDPGRQALADTFAVAAQPDRSARHGRGRVLETGVAELKERIDDAAFAQVQADIGWDADTAASLRRLGYAASITVPILIDGRVRGILAAFRSEPGARYRPDDVTPFEDLARRAATAIGNAENYMRESRASQLFQNAFLPDTLPDVPGIEFSAIYSPGEAEAQIGGDWYDAFPLPDGRIVVSIGDVTGRGLQAAVIMAKIRQSLETMTYFERDPARLLEAADATLRRIDPDALVTALVGVLDPTRGTLSYAVAGHPPPILIAPNGDVVALPGRGLPLGMRSDVETPTTTVRLPDGALIVLFTDGLIESTHDVLEGEQRLHEALADIDIVGSDNPARAIQRRVLFDGSPDDVAILTMRYTADAEPPLEPSPTPETAYSMHWSFDAREARTSQAVRTVYLQYLRELAVDGADLGGAELVFGELVSNVVRHAPGPIEIELEWTATQPVLHVLDRGPGFPQRAILPDDAFSESGRGLFLIDKLTEHFTVTTLPGYGTHARAVLRVRRAGPGDAA